MRIIGIDLGERRIGVAAADERTGVAVPVATVDATMDAAVAVAKVLAEQGADEVVVGLPLSMTGAIGPQGQRAMEVVEVLRERLGMPVHTWDERLTTVQAGRSFGHSGRSRRKREERKGGRDAAAAAILLQAFLDSRRSV